MVTYCLLCLGRSLKQLRMRMDGHGPNPNRTREGRPSVGQARAAEARRVRVAAHHARSVAEFADELRRDGVGDATVRKVLSLVQGVLGRAVVLGRIRANPVVPVRKPVQGRRRAVRPLTPTKVDSCGG